MRTRNIRKQYFLNEEEADELIAHLLEKYPHVEFYKSYFGAVIGTHLGEGSLALGWIIR